MSLYTLGSVSNLMVQQSLDTIILSLKGGSKLRK